MKTKIDLLLHIMKCEINVNIYFFDAAVPSPDMCTYRIFSFMISLHIPQKKNTVLGTLHVLWFW